MQYGNRVGIAAGDRGYNWLNTLSYAKYCQPHSTHLQTNANPFSFTDDLNGQTSLMRHP